MSEYEEKAVGRGVRSEAASEAVEEATPGRTTRAKDETGDASAFAGAKWESIGEAAAPDSGDVLAEVKAGLDAEVQAMASSGKGVHRCFAGCVHDQFDMMMSAHAQQKGFKKAPGAIEEAARRAGGKPDAAKPDAKTPPKPEDAASSLGEMEQVGHAGTVSAGKPGGFPGILGLAKWDFAKFGYPALNINTQQKPDKSWDATIQSTTSKDAPTSAVATPVGAYNIGTEQILDPNTNKNVNMKKILDVDATAAGQIKVAEQEHLDDVTEAYSLTLKAAEDAVNANANSPFNAPKKADAEKHAKNSVKNALDPKLTANPRTWSSMLQTAANLTRSGRDASSWHTFNYTAGANDIDFTAKTVTYHVDNNPNVGVTPSSSLIKL